MLSSSVVYLIRDIKGRKNIFYPYFLFSLCLISANKIAKNIFPKFPSGSLSSTILAILLDSLVFFLFYTIQYLFLKKLYNVTIFQNKEETCNKYKETIIEFTKLLIRFGLILLTEYFVGCIFVVILISFIKVTFKIQFPIIESTYFLWFIYISFYIFLYIKCIQIIFALPLILTSKIKMKYKQILEKNKYILDSTHKEYLIIYIVNIFLFIMLCACQVFFQNNNKMLIYVFPFIYSVFQLLPFLLFYEYYRVYYSLEEGKREI